MKSNRKIIVQVAPEASYGVDPDANYVAIQTRVGSEISPQGEKQERDTVSATFSPKGHTFTAKQFTGRLPLFLIGGGLSGSVIQPPPTASLLKASGMEQIDGLVIPFDALVGTFQIGEELQITTGSLSVGYIADITTSGATGTLYIRNATANVPADNDGLTGVTSGATADANGTPDDALCYRPTSDRDSMGSAALRYNLDGNRHVALGIRSSFSLDLSSGKHPMIDFSFQSIYSSPADVAAPSVNYVNVTPSTVKGMGLAIGDTDMSKTAINSLALDLGNEIQVRPDMNAADGIASLEIGNRIPTGSIDPEVTALADMNPFSDWENGTKQAIHATVGSTAGERIYLSVPRAQYDTLSYAERNNSAVYQLPFTAIGGSEGDDEFWMFFY